MPMKQLITNELVSKVNSQGKRLTPAQWFTINSYIGMQKFHLLNMLQYIKPERIYDIIEISIKELKEKKG